MDEIQMEVFWMIAKVIVISVCIGLPIGIGPAGVICDHSYTDEDDERRFDQRLDNIERQLKEINESNKKRGG